MAQSPVEAAPESLDTLRARIDELDERIAHLLQERARLSLAVGKAKTSGRSTPVPIFVPDRESAVLAHVRSTAGPLAPDALASIYREVLSTSRALQRPIRVAHLGPRATFGHQAALTQFGSSAQFEPVLSNTEVFTAVEKGVADFGMVPFENSTEGPVNEVLDRFVDTPLRVCAEVVIPIAQCLMGSAPDLASVKRVLTHPQAAAQCRSWLAEHLPGVPVEAYASTGGAAELSATDPAIAAVAPRLAAEVFNLKLLAENIQDRPDNVTRFLVLGLSPSERPTGRDRTAVVFSIRDRVGALRDLTDAFASSGVNLSSIQSRPSRRRAWDYVFFVELEGHLSEPRVTAALGQAQEHTVFFKVLGSWPAAPD